MSKEGGRESDGCLTRLEGVCSVVLVLVVHLVESIPLCCCSISPSSHTTSSTTARRNSELERGCSHSATKVLVDSPIVVLVLVSSCDSSRGVRGSGRDSYRIEVVGRESEGIVVFPGFDGVVVGHGEKERKGREGRRCRARDAALLEREQQEGEPLMFESL